ncbi:MAG: serine/threonine protein kinase [Tidjanibacter sp.]|nr:serine/threonine protein kinase [Tidjanibacter sp.]
MKNKILINTLIESLSFEDKMFRTIPDVEPRMSPMGGPKFTSGRNSAVFDVMSRGKRYALKAYTEPLPYGEEICRVAQTLPEHLIIHPKMYCEELWVGDRYTDVMLYDWVNGRSFDWWIRKAHYDRSSQKLRELARKFTDLAIEMLDSDWRHGDIKPENILVREDGSLILVDCDTLYSPTLPARKSLGTPHYIHPARKDAYDSHIDDYSIALILLSLEALRRNIELYNGETMVALPSENTPETLLPLFADCDALVVLYEAMRSEDYKIDNLKQLLINVQRTDNTQE